MANSISPHTTFRQGLVFVPSLRTRAEKVLCFLIPLVLVLVLLLLLLLSWVFVQAEHPA